MFRDMEEIPRVKYPMCTIPYDLTTLNLLDELAFVAFSIAEQKVNIL